jgi:predicted nucleotidyltransferase
MKTFGEEIKSLREQAKLPLRTVAAHLDIDQAILSKIENGKRSATKNQVTQLADYFKVNEKKLMVNYLSDKIVSELKYEPFNREILMVAEEKIAYGNALVLNQDRIISKLKEFFINESKVIAAYLFGSTARNEANIDSDIDIMIELSSKEKHTMFDLLDIQDRLQTLFNKKVDVVEKGYVKPHAKDNVEKDMKLIIKK